MAALRTRRMTSFAPFPSGYFGAIADISIRAPSLKPLTGIVVRAGLGSCNGQGTIDHAGPATAIQEADDADK